MYKAAVIKLVSIDDILILKLCARKKLRKTETVN